MLSLGRQAQSATCLTTAMCLTADPGVTSSIPVPYLWEIDHGIFSMAILFPSADSRRVVVSYKQKHKVLVYPFSQACPGKKCG